MNFSRNLISSKPVRFFLRLLLWSPVFFIFGPLILEFIPGVGQSIGYCSAKFDTLRGHYELKSNGLSHDWWEKHVGRLSWEERRAWEKRHRELLQERYGIQSPGWFMGPCVEFRVFRDYRYHYDQTQRAAIAGKFGQNAIIECALKVSEELKVKPPPSPFAGIDDGE